MIKCLFHPIDKENVDYLLRLRSFQVSPNTYNNHIRVKAHAIGVSVVASLLVVLLILGEFQEQDSKRTLLPICLYICLSAHWRKVFKG